MVSLMEYLHLLAVGVLIGKVVLLSFVVAPILVKNLEREPFGTVVRQLFPAYYALGMGTAIVGLVSLAGLALIRGISTTVFVVSGTWLIILVAEAYCRSALTPQSNVMRHRLREQESRGAVDPILKHDWNRLHLRSVYLNSLVLLAGPCLLGLVSPCSCTMEERIMKSCIHIVSSVMIGLPLANEGD
jgi:uncharacterized protein DUF4149